MNDVAKAINDFRRRINEVNRFRDNILSNQHLMDVIKKQNAIRNNNTIAKAFEYKHMQNWANYFPNASFNQYLKRIDAITTIKKNPKLLSQSLSYSNVINRILQDFNTDILDEYDEDLLDDSESGSFDDGEDLEYDVKRPAFFNLAFKINYVIYTTDGEVEKGNIEGDDKRNWEKYAKPVLKVLFTIFLAWAFSSTPITDSNIYERLADITEHIDLIDIEDNEDNNED
ncbi:hypothetical protein [Virgibacillus litoralis]|uniref:Uncharacterized protein n=1 Tax=Virgibacillus litoralis TaxID=578221 RepID=A0ABS4HH68_9BACI|nr:hypothetical protein [Virgibacillus litoralis]MBP1950274.1 hypothetical protein [Virgibacillus litoralis]